MTKEERYIPEIFDITEVDLPYQGKNCLYGSRPCVIYDKIGSNYRIVPIKNNNGKLHWCEYPIEKGRCNLRKNSKLKLDQEKNVSIEQIKFKIGKADNDIKKAISNYFKTIANKIDKAFSTN